MNESESFKAFRIANYGITIAELAKQVEVSQMSMWKMVRDGVIPEPTVKRPGVKRTYYGAEEVKAIKKMFRK